MSNKFIEIKQKFDSYPIEIEGISLDKAIENIKHAKDEIFKKYPEATYLQISAFYDEDSFDVTIDFYRNMSAKEIESFHKNEEKHNKFEYEKYLELKEKFEGK